MSSARCHCRSCRYDLAGLAAGPCPECGALFDPADPETFTDLRAPRWIVALSCVVAAIPWISIFSLYATWFAGRVALGHWPRPSQDDPKDIADIGLWYVLALGLIGITCLALLPAAGTVIGLLGFGILRRSPWALWLGALLLLSWAFALAMLWFDPGYAVTWYFD